MFVETLINHQKFGILVGEHMETKKNKLFLGGVGAEAIIKKFGSPCYVYEEDTILQRFNELDKAITYPKKKLLFACKANTNAVVMRTLLEKGVGLDVVSIGEMQLALDIGFKPKDILFTATAPTDEELQQAIDAGVVMNMDSLSEMRRYGALNKGGKCSVRINPEFGAGFHGHVVTGGPDSKFGVYHDKVDEINAVAKEFNLTVIGVHMHVGSRYLNPDQFYKAMEILLGVAKQFKKLEFVDFGGGIGVVMSPDEKLFDLKAYGEKVSSIFTDFCREYGKKLDLIFENGRWFVAEAGFLLCTVNTLKSTPKFAFAGVDTGFHHLLRPAMYGSYHDIYNASNMDGDEEDIVIAGNICESCDTFTRDENGVQARKLPKIKEGDVLAIGNAGAYGYTMSSNYNTRGRPPEVMVKNGKAELIRAGEKYEDVIRGQII
tara:strand:- start:148 stop:1446 length:1299 start_codon:yes stop_codon:yes gene_type:complete